MNLDIRIPYNTRPLMTKNSGPVFNTRPDPLYIQEKNRELEIHGSKLWAVTDPRFVDRASRYCGFPPTHDILKLALLLEEDIAILNHGKLVAICFCFPSSWHPTEKLGQTLAEIHQPVADNIHLVAASDKLAAVMSNIEMGSMTRTVWTVTANSKLSNYPDGEHQWNPRSLDDLYFRWEVQTTAPLGDGSTSLFFVKVHVVPLRSVWDTHGQQIKDSINSMTSAVLRYKNLVDIREILNTTSDSCSISVETRG